MTDDSNESSTEEDNIETAGEIFPGPFNPVGHEIVGEVNCYDQFELTFELKIDKLVLKAAV